MQKGLRISFIIHFTFDVAFAVPLMLFPEWILTHLGWSTVDPITSRIVAAALFGIGIESLLGRNASLSGFLPMLRLKIIWSTSALTGLLLSLQQGYFTYAGVGLLFIGIFFGFNLLWIFWYRQVRKQLRRV